MSCNRNSQSGSGNKIKVFACILPQCNRDEPKDVTVTATSAASLVTGSVILSANAFTAGSTQITIDGATTAPVTTLNVDALPRAVPLGSVFIINLGQPTQTTITVTADAAAGATSLTVSATTDDIADNSVGIGDLPAETTLSVVATTVALPIGAQILFNEGQATEQTVTLTAAATTGATNLTTEPLANNLAIGSSGEILPNITLNVNPLSGSIARGTRLTFNKDTPNETRGYLALDVDAGAQQVLLEDISGDIAIGDVANFIAKLRILGGTSTGFNLNPNRSGFQLFEDEGGYEDGVVTNGTWDAPWTGNYLVDDESYERIKFAARRSPVDNREIYLWSEKPAPVGKTTGETDKGPTLITGLSESLPSDGILTSTWTFSGQGTPNFDRPK